METLKQFYVGVKGVIYNPSIKKALVLKKPDQKGKFYWDIPGGRIDDSETIEETLRRELSEEIINLGNDYTVERLLNAYRLSRDLNDGLGLVLLFYKVETDIEEIEHSAEHLEYKWVGVSDLESLKFTDDAYIESGYLDALKLALE